MGFETTFNGPSAASQTLTISGTVNQGSSGVSPWLVSASLSVESIEIGTVDQGTSGSLPWKAEVWGRSKGSTLSTASTVRSVSPNVNSVDTYDNAPTQAIYNYSTARYDASAVRATDTTITFTGPTIASGQLIRIRCIIDSATKPLVWEQGRNAALTMSAGVITVYPLDGTTAPVPNTVTQIEVMWGGPEKEVSPYFTNSTEYGDATVAYASGTTLTLTAGTGVGQTLPTTGQLVSVIVITSTGARIKYINGNGCYLSITGGTLTLAGCQATPFTTGGSADVGYIVRWNATPRIYDMAPTLLDYNYQTDRGDASATRAGNTTITFNGPTIIAQQIRKIMVYDVTGAVFAQYEQGRNGVLFTISAGVITIAGAGTTPVPVNALVNVCWSAQDKGFDPGLQAQRNAPMYGPNSMYDIPFQIVNVANVTKSDSVSYYPASTGIDMSGYTDIAFDISAVAGASTSPLYVWLEASDDSTFPGATALPTSPLNIGYNCSVINSATPLGNQSLTVTAAATLIATWQAENLNFQFVRMCFLNPAANANNSGAVLAYARRKYQ